MSNATLTIGIDIGTTSVKGVVADDDGRVVRRSRRPHQVNAPHPDVFEHDPADAWRDGVLTTYAELSDGLDIAGVTVAAMVPSLCGLDRAGRPVTPGLLYGDARGREAAGRGGVEGEVVGFARWLLAQPGVSGLRPAQALANAALCDVAAIDTGTAMTMMPLFAGSGWDVELCSSLGTTPDALPGLSPGAMAIGRTPKGVPVSGGTIDAYAEQLVSDARAPGDVLVICGTTLIVWSVTDDWRAVDGLWSVPFTAPGTCAIGGASNAGGLFVDRVRRMVGSDAGTGAAVPAGTGRNVDDLPVWLPYLRGERTPLHDPARRAELLDVHLGHGPAELLQAAFEATGFVVRHHVELAGVDARRLVVVGGGTRSGEWMQALADVTGLPADVSSIPDGAALGAAYVSRVTAGLEPDFSGGHRWATIGHRVEPRADVAEGCAARYLRFLEGTRR